MKILSLIVPFQSTIRFHSISILLALMMACNHAVTEELQMDMVSIPGGAFLMGDFSGEGREHEMPVREVVVSAFKLGKYEVTFAQWDACVADGGCDSYRPDDGGFGRGNLPVLNVSWDDVQGFIAWLNEKTGGNYRLPTEAEWEYAARAGSITDYYSWVDDTINNCDDCTTLAESLLMGMLKGEFKTIPVGSFPSDVWGLHDMYGNVHEWVQDCWNDSYAGAPSDGSAWESGDCNRRVVRSEHWSGLFFEVVALSGPSKGRTNGTRSERGAIGFRVAHDH